MRIYDPNKSIEDESSLQDAFEYVAEESSRLSKKVTGNNLPLDTLTIFAQSDEEYRVVGSIIRKIGEVSPYSHNTTLYIETRLQIANQEIQLLGVRQPDASRTQRGYGDYPVEDLHVIQNELHDNQYVQEIKSGNGISLLELRHPDFNVLGYVVELEKR